jgi:transposase
MWGEGPSRKRSPADLTDAPWALVGPMLPPAQQSHHGGRPREVERRDVLNTRLYLNRSGCQGAMLPHDLRPKSPVDDDCAQWRDDGTWTSVVKALRERHRVAAGRDPPPVPPASRAHRSRPPRGEAPSAALMAARTSTGASGICGSRPWAC